MESERLIQAAVSSLESFLSLEKPRLTGPLHDAYHASAKSDAPPFENQSSILITTFVIDGMTCGACSAGITSALEALEGVLSALVSPISNCGKFIHSSTVTTLQIADTISQCGFIPTLESLVPLQQSPAPLNPEYNTILSVKGMTCGSCSASVTDALLNIPGVKLASVLLILEEASICHGLDVDPSALASAVENCGFEATVLSTVELRTLHPSSDDSDDMDDISMRINGIDAHTDLEALHYNIDAFIKSLPGVHSHTLILCHTDDEQLDEPTIDDENLQESSLSIRYKPRDLGIRRLVQGLNNVSSLISFSIINSIDQSSESQLRILSRDKEISRWRNNFLQTLAFGAPIMFLARTHDWPIWKHLFLIPGLFSISLLELLLASYVQFRLGRTFLKGLVKFVRNKCKGAGMDVLVSILTLSSFGFSLFAIAWGVWRGDDQEPPQLLFDTSALIICLISLGKYLENKAKGATSTALTQLVSLTPTSGTIIADPVEYEQFLATHIPETSVPDFATQTLAIDMIQQDDIAVVLPGSKIPADGSVVLGETEIDESIITGESLPVYKQLNDFVIGGSINGNHTIHIRVVRSGKRSQLQKIINLVKESQINKAPVQRHADYVASRFVPAVLAMSVTTLLVWFAVCYYRSEDRLPPLFSHEKNGKFFVCLKMAISVVVVACPCALGLAAPTAVMVGTGLAATNGVLIKGGDVLEKASDINIVLFDKTGTLTNGDMRLKDYLNQTQMGADDWWTLIASLEGKVNHPVGNAIFRAAMTNIGKSHETDFLDTQTSDVLVMTGSCASALVVMRGVEYSVAIGNKRMIEQRFPSLIKSVTDSELDGLLACTKSYVVINREFAGVLELYDEVKSLAKQVVDYLRLVENYQVGMVTGDNPGSALRVGRELGIPAGNIFSKVSPINKDAVIREMRDRLGGPNRVGIAFVGDGINDAPALVQADIGMAISSGTDIAIESADVVLLSPSGKSAEGKEIANVLYALMVSDATFSRIKMNFVWAGIYNVIMLPFAMGFFLPFNLVLPPIVALAAMALSSLSVVLNSLGLKLWNPPQIERLSSSDQDLESKAVHFSLSEGTAAEFDSVKRKRTHNHRRSRNIADRIRSLFARPSQSYEMLPTDI